MIAAVALAQQGVDVALLEANDVPGKKILATGNGKCNFTNTFQSEQCYRGQQPGAAMELLKRYDVAYVLRFFEGLGILAKQREGYWYPNSEQAASVREAFALRLFELSVPICVNTHVDQIRKEKNFIIKASCREKLSDGRKTSGKTSGKKTGKPLFSQSREVCFEAEYVVLATGGCAGNVSGADGSGYALAESLGHRVVLPVPALVQLKIGGQAHSAKQAWTQADAGREKRAWQALAGVRTHAKLSLCIEDVDGTRQEHSERGEILFTDYGLSGIPTMQLSRFAARKLAAWGQAKKAQCGKIEVLLDFFPDTSENDLQRMLVSRFQTFPGRTARDALIGLLPSKLNAALLEKAGLLADIAPARQSGKGNDEAARCAEMLARCMKHFAAPVCGTNGFENAQVTAGGVALCELHVQTMESKLVGGLYAIGELADIDGTCGGYNLQWAWMSGLAAAEAICRRKKK